MLVIPAIDLQDGQCVRLLQGKKDAVTVYSDNPSGVARRWQTYGAKLLHIVDLDGAFSGRQMNLDIIITIRKAVTIALQVGGGIRHMESVADLLSAGIDRVILGTAAIQDPELLTEACRRYPGRILVGIDAKDGKVAIRGWEEVTGVEAAEMARGLEIVGVSGIIYTDIHRDGMLTGPNVAATQGLVASVNIPVIASGGVSSIEDIRQLMQIKNLWGVITGKAIYSGKLDLREALAMVSQQQC